MAYWTCYTTLIGDNMPDKQLKNKIFFAPNSLGTKSIFAILFAVLSSLSDFAQQECSKEAVWLINDLVTIISIFIN